MMNNGNLQHASERLAKESILKIIWKRLQVRRRIQLKQLCILQPIESCVDVSCESVRAMPLDNENRAGIEQINKKDMLTASCIWAANRRISV